MTRLVLLAAIAAALSCVKSNATQCGDLVCPVGLACAGDVCVDEHLVSACVQHADGDACSLGEGGDGLCQSGLCIVGRCGDGVVNGVEACDGIALGGKTCADFGGAGTLACGSDCTFDKSGCSAFCGNGHADPGEDCDGSDFAQKSCIDFGYYGGTLACTSDCKTNLGGCMGQCGNGVIEGLEVCDGANLNGQTCATLGYNGAVLPLTCTTGCAYAASSCTCGGGLCMTNQTCADEGGGVFSCQ